MPGKRSFVHSRKPSTRARISSLTLIGIIVFCIPPAVATVYDPFKIQVRSGSDHASMNINDLRMDFPDNLTEGTLTISGRNLSTPLGFTTIVGAFDYGYSNQTCNNLQAYHVGENLNNYSFDVDFSYSTDARNTYSANYTAKYVIKNIQTFNVSRGPHHGSFELRGPCSFPATTAASMPVYIPGGPIGTPDASNRIFVGTGYHWAALGYYNFNTTDVLPLANFTATPLYGPAPLTVNFTDTSTGTPTGWSWEFGDGQRSVQQNPQYRYNASGTYSVNLTVSNSAGSNQTRKVNYLSVTSRAPVSNFTATPLAGPANLTVAFTDTSTNTPTSWSWRFGDGTTSTSRNVSHKYTAAGLYTVNHSAKNSYGTSWINRTAYINVTMAKPVANFTGTPRSGGKPLTVQFNDTSLNTVTSYYWLFGDGVKNSTLRNPTFTYTKAGNYTVRHSATNPSGTVWKNVSAYVKVTNAVLPVANFTGTPTSGTAPLTVQFNDTSTGSPTSWNWEFGDGAVSAEQNLSHTYTAAGTYTVALNVSNAGGWNRTVKLDYVNVEPPGYPERYAYIEAGEGGCAETDVRAFRDAILNDPHGWQDAITPISLPIYSADSRVKHWADGSAFSGGQSNDYLNKADFAYFHGHGNMNGVIPSIHFDQADPDGIHELSPSMAKWGYEIPGSRTKWITFHSCDSLDYATWESWKQSFYGLHSLLGYDSSTTCPPKSTGEAFAQLMKGDYPSDPAVYSIWNAWQRANYWTMDSRSYKLGMVYVIGCEEDYLLGFGDSSLNCNPQRNAQGSYNLNYSLFDPETPSYTSTEKTLKKTQEMKKTDGIFSIDILIIPVPEKIQIYIPVKPDYSQDQVEKLSRGLTLSNQNTDARNDIQKAQEDQKSKSLSTGRDSRIITYVDSTRDDLSADKIKRPLSDSQAVAKVTGVLSEADLMPSDAVIDATRHYSAKRLMKSGSGETTDDRTMVYIHREMDGLMVENSNVIAEVGDSGKISQLLMNWRDYEPYKETDTKSAEAAFGEFINKTLQYHSNTPPEKVVVTDMTLRYYSHPPAISEKYLQPVYVFEGYVETDNVTKPFDPVYIPATIEQFDQIPEGC